MKSTLSLFGVSLMFIVHFLGAEPLSSKDLQSAKKIINNLCIACHGADGNSAISVNPKLAGQHAAYITKQLMNFKSGKRDNAVMAGMVATLTEQDMINLGLYFSNQKITLSMAKWNRFSWGKNISSWIIQKRYPSLRELSWSSWTWYSRYIP